MSSTRVVRILSATAVAIVLSVAAYAELGAQLPRLPGRPKLPGTKSPAPPPAERSLYCAGITDDSIDRYLKALAEQKRVLASELAAADARKAQAEAKKAQADAMARKRAEVQVAELVKTAECTGAFTDKDPRSKEITRLEQLAEQATNQGNEAKADEYQRKSSQLGEALAVDADRACGGRGVSAIFDCAQRRTAADPRAKERDRLRRLANDAGQQGNKQKQAEHTQAADQLDGVMRAEAQVLCMQEAPGIVGTAPSAEEEAANREAAELLRNSQSNADEAGADAAGLTRKEFTRLDHCIRGVLKGDPATPTTPESTAAINGRRADLTKAIGR